jgi:hypothetical protein
MRLFRDFDVLCRGHSAAGDMRDHGDKKQHDENEKQYFRHFNGDSRNAAETEHARNQGNNQKCKGPLQHGFLLFDFSIGI